GEPPVRQVDRAVGEGGVAQDAAGQVDSGQPAAFDAYALQSGLRHGDLAEVAVLDQAVADQRTRPARAGPAAGPHRRLAELEQLEVGALEVYAVVRPARDGRVGHEVVGGPRRCRGG